jgi:hypothetical protein
VKILVRPFRVLITLWAGSLWSLLWVATVLFRFLSDRHTAGLIAARLFSIETYLGLAVAALAVMLPARGRFRAGYLAVALLAVNEWLLKRAMSLAQTQGSALGLGFGAWHGVSAGLYVLACFCVVVLIYQDEYRHV